MAHDAGVGEAALHVLRAEPRDLGEIEIGEGGAEVLALAQNRDPREPGLEALQAELLEEAAVVARPAGPIRCRDSEIERVGARPPAARPAVGPSIKPSASGMCSLPELADCGRLPL